MNVATARDLAIIITSILNTAVLVSVFVIIFLAYRRVRVILDSVAEASGALRDAAAVVKRCARTLDFTGKIFKKSRGGKKE